MSFVKRHSFLQSIALVCPLSIFAQTAIES